MDEDSLTGTTTSAALRTRQSMLSNWGSPRACHPDGSLWTSRQPYQPREILHGRVPSSSGAITCGRWQWSARWLSAFSYWRHPPSMPDAAEGAGAVTVGMAHGEVTPSIPDLRMPASPAVGRVACPWARWIWRAWRLRARRE